MMKWAIAAGVLGLCCLGAAAEELELEPAKLLATEGDRTAQQPILTLDGPPLKRPAQRQAGLDREWVQRFSDFANVDALPTFPSRAGVGQALTRRIPTLPSVSLPGVARNGFGLELPSLGLRSPASSVRLLGPRPFGGPSFSSPLPSFGAATPGFNPQQVFRSLPAGLPSLGGSGGLFGNRSGRHSSTSLPFLDSSDTEDLTTKIEAVKIAEHALKELNGTSNGSVGGFKMMKFLYKLIKRVRPKQKGMVIKLLVLITVPYFATLAVSWFLGPTTAMDMTWPGAKKGIVKVIERVLKTYGRIGGAINIQDYASQLSQGVGQLGSLPGQLSGRVQGSVTGAARRQATRVTSRLGNLPRRATRAAGSRLPRLGTRQRF